jgi:hypothetical protein
MTDDDTENTAEENEKIFIKYIAEAFINVRLKYKQDN